MNSPGTEKNKLILIGVLSVIFVLVAYVRFFSPAGRHGTGSPAASPAGSPAVAAAPGGGPGQNAVPLGNVLRPQETITRDIFSPPGSERASGRSKASLEGPADLMPQPSFKLSGVIGDQGAAVAVINGKFLKKGDWIEEYQVIGIDDSKVVLNGSGGMKIVLPLLKTVDKQF